MRPVYARVVVCPKCLRVVCGLYATDAGTIGVDIISVEYSGSELVRFKGQVFFRWQHVAAGRTLP